MKCGTITLWNTTQLYRKAKPQNLQLMDRTRKDHIESDIPDPETQISHVLSHFWFRSTGEHTTWNKLRN